MSLWNQRNLHQPPNITFKASNTDLDLNKLKNALQDGISHFRDNKILNNELAILSRILYRMKMKFRSAKDFKLLEKVRRCLDLFYRANLAGYLKNLLHMVPSEYRNTTYLPSKNMLQYVLVRLQGLVKLMERTYDTCILVASELNSRLYIGHFWKLFFILFALVSRITVLIKFNTKFLCELYGKLLSHCNKLQIVGTKWLPENYILPTDLRSWLGVPWVYEEEFVDLTFESNNSIVDFFNLVDDDEDDNDVLFCDEYILLDDEDKNIINDFNKLPSIKKSLHHNRMRGFSISEEDIGEDIIEVPNSMNINEELETIEEDVELQLNQPKMQVELEDSGEEIPLEDPSVISVSDSPRSSVITIDDTVIHQKSTGKKKKKNNHETADKSLTPKSTKRKLSFSGEGSTKKKLKKIQQILSGKKLKKKKQKTENLINNDSVICLDDDSFVQGSSRQSSTKVLSKETYANGTNKSMFLSLDVTSEKENAGRSKLKNVCASGNKLNNQPKLGNLKKGRYWQTGSQLKVSKSPKKTLKSNKKSLKKRKNKR